MRKIVKKKSKNKIKNYQIFLIPIATYALAELVVTKTLFLGVVFAINELSDSFC